jgi:nucleoside-diphosphate-sugar epimerase
MKIFLTGSTGFIGRHLMAFYRDHEIFEHKRHTDLETNLQRFEPDVIINCAAEIYKPEDMWVPNVEWTLTCLEHVRKNPHTKMVQIGSSAEYGPLPRASAETDRINPVDMYQATKGAATLLCQGYARQYKLDISVARPYSVYGQYEKPHRLFSRLWRAFKKNESMKLFHGYHDFIYIDDFVRGIDILVNTQDKPLGDIVNFGSGSQYSNLDVLNVFENISGHKASVEIVDTMAKEFESDVWICNTEYAEKQYGFKAEISLTNGISKILKLENYN